MSRMGDEMILALAASLNSGLNKTAEKEDDEDKKECKCGKEDCKCGCEGDSDKCKCKKKEKKDKKDKKADAAYVIGSLYKLANELDEMGAEEAASLVDDALKVIVQNIKDSE